jgi:hypothetical protein
MKTTLLPLLLFIVLPFMLNAQNAKKTRSNCGCSFSSINQAGVMEGSAGSSFHVQTINGIRYKSWFTGLGVGLDHYRYRTIPVFFDVRKDLLNKVNTPFLFGDVGVHVPWLDDKNKTWWGDSEFNRGLYYDAGVGYKLNIGKSRALLFSGGFSLKKMRETRFIPVMCITAPCPDQREYYDFSLKRFSLKAGLQL